MAGEKRRVLSIEEKEVMKGKEDEKKQENKRRRRGSESGQGRYLMSPGRNALERDFSCWTQMEKISLALPGGND